MLDPLSALGLAANIFQVLEFSCKIVSSGIAISKSVRGTSDNTGTLDSIASKLQSLCDDIGTSRSASTRAERELHELAEECRKVATELVTILSDLHLHGNHGKWQSLRIAFLESQKSGRIEAISNRLAKLQAQLSIHLLKILNDKQSDVSEQLEKLRRDSRQYNEDRALQLRQMQDEIVSNLQSVMPDAALFNDNVENFWQSIKQLEPVRQVDVDLLSARIEALSLSITNIVARGRDANVENMILRSLSFQEIRQRYEDIPQAHASTFKWIFHQQGPFANWMRAQDAGIFWIRGKPGSGKSTLMKYITRQDETAKFLKAWAGPKKLVVAKYFFWNAGTPMQKTLHGLLRSFLFDILHACPNFVHHLGSVVPASSYDGSFESQAWSFDDLAKAIENITAITDMSTKFVFFIDGLDEYGGGYCDELIDVIKHIGGRPLIKLCVSSRPWNEFADAFGADPKLVLRLEDLTRSDIQQYVGETLEKNSNYRLVKSRDKRYLQLTEEIVARAQGVFLWVVLVVRSLLRGLTNADRISDLQLRLRALPTDLEKFFDHMLNSVEDVYKPQSVDTLYLALHTEQPLPLIIYSFLDEDDNFAMSEKIRMMDSVEIEWRQLEMRKRINGRTRGILEIFHTTGQAPDSSFDNFEEGSNHLYQVDFLHRTARDYVRKSTKLHEKYGNPDDSYEGHCQRLQQAYLAQLKLDPLAELNRTVLNMMFYVRKAGSECSKSSLEVLRESNKAFGYRKYQLLTADARTRVARFTELAIACGMVSYIQDKVINDSDFIHDALQPPLLGALAPSVAHAPLVLSYEMIKMLLQYGANPNQEVSGSTIWQRLVRGLQGSLKIHEKDQLLRVMKILVEAGADLKAPITMSSKRQILAYDVVRTAFSEAEAEEILTQPKSNIQPTTPVQKIGQIIQHTSQSMSDGQALSSREYAPNKALPLPGNQDQKRSRWSRLGSRLGMYKTKA